MHLLDLTVLLQQVISLTQTLICKPLSRYSGSADLRAHDFEKCKNVFSFSRGSSESSEIHPHWNCCVTPDLLPGLFWRICCPHPHDAVPFAQCSQPSARGIYIHWLGPCEIVVAVGSLCALSTRSEKHTHNPNSSNSLISYFYVLVSQPAGIDVPNAPCSLRHGQGWTFLQISR